MHTVNLLPTEQSSDARSVCPCSNNPPAERCKVSLFLYTRFKTVRVNMESCYGGMSTRLKQRAVTEEGGQLFSILLLGMSHGFIILTLKKND